MRTHTNILLPAGLSAYAICVCVWGCLEGRGLCMRVVRCCVCVYVYKAIDAISFAGDLHGSRGVGDNIKNI